MSGFPTIDVMPSSSIMPYPQPNSGRAGRAPSSFIDGLSHHPSVHATSFLPSTPPPMVHGLERHPDAPKPFSMDLSEEPAPFVLDDYFNSAAPSSFSNKSRFSSRRPSFQPASQDGSFVAQHESVTSTPNLSPTASIVSATSSTGLPQRLDDVDDLTAEGSPFDDPTYEQGDYVGSNEAEETFHPLPSTFSELPTTFSGLPPFSATSSVFSNWAGCSKQSHTSSRYSLPARSVLSELLSDYLRRSARI